ncbi:MAG: hypothetical protein AAF928_11230 [Myxococcota bacterium]
MPKLRPKVLVHAATDYLKAHPEEVVRALRSAVGLRAGIPLDALRYLIAEVATGPKAPTDVVIEAVPPGLRAGLTIRAMGTTIRVRVTVFIEELDLGADKAMVTARIADLELEVLEGEDSPVAGLIKSGALDLSKPGNLVAYMPKRPELLIEAVDDRITVDLMKVPKLRDHPQVRRALDVAVPVVTIAGIQTKDDHLDVQFRATPTGIRASIAAVQQARR